MYRSLICSSCAVVKIYILMYILLSAFLCTHMSVSVVCMPQNGTSWPKILASLLKGPEIKKLFLAVALMYVLLQLSEHPHFPHKRHRGWHCCSLSCGDSGTYAPATPWPCQPKGPKRTMHRHMSDEKMKVKTRFLILWPKATHITSTNIREHEVIIWQHLDLRGNEKFSPWLGSCFQQLYDV